jgi:hypothetical protein
MKQEQEGELMAAVMQPRLYKKKLSLAGGVPAGI